MTDNQKMIEYLIAQGQRTGRFADANKILHPGASCDGCKRKYYSYPDACNDGWPIRCPAEITMEYWLSKAESCYNYEEKEVS